MKIEKIYNKNMDVLLKSMSVERSSELGDHMGEGINIQDTYGHVVDGETTNSSPGTEGGAKERCHTVSHIS